ncbi:unnamed protein product [Cladocopium goreaui]|uniref:Major facilitator superfamily (MFS) profile domain-containing protein n=1 Tax=Cladocopium goreaui TaxID=2562237 RepID=A0A9P1BVD3_9DINO|nr:unnamed protein product [Cladocopium goreaui]
MVLAFAAISWSALAIAMPMVADFGFGHTWLLLILLGVAASPLMPTTMQLLSAYVPASERGCSLAARALSMRFGQIVASVLAPLICSQAGWRASFAIFGTVSLLLAFLWLGFAMTKSREAGMEIARKMWEDALDNTGEVVVATGGTAKADSLLPLWALKHPGFLALLAVHCSNNFAMYTIMSWGPSYFTEVLELPLESVGLYLMLPAAFSGIGAITGGVCTDWLQSRRCPILFPAAAGAGLSLVCFGNLHSVPAASLAMIAAAMWGGTALKFSFSFKFSEELLLRVPMPKEGNGATGGILCKATLPGAAGPALVALLLESTGLWSLVWGIIAACLIAPGRYEVLGRTAVG